MAITTTTITKNAGWARTDVIDQLEEAFTWLELHGTQISGLVTSISTYSGGGTVGSSGIDYFDVPVVLPLELEQEHLSMFIEVVDLFNQLM